MKYPWLPLFSLNSHLILTWFSPYSDLVLTFILLRPYVCFILILDCYLTFYVILSRCLGGWIWYDLNHLPGAFQGCGCSQRFLLSSMLLVFSYFHIFSSCYLVLLILSPLGLQAPCSVEACLTASSTSQVPVKFAPHISTPIIDLHPSCVDPVSIPWYFIHHLGSHHPTLTD